MEEIQNKSDDFWREEPRQRVFEHDVKPYDVLIHLDLKQSILDYY